MIAVACLCLRERGREGGVGRGGVQGIGGGGGRETVREGRVEGRTEGKSERKRKRKRTSERENERVCARAPPGEHDEADDHGPSLHLHLHTHTTHARTHERTNSAPLTPSVWLRCPSGAGCPRAPSPRPWGRQDADVLGRGAPSPFSLSSRALLSSPPLALSSHSLLSRSPLSPTPLALPLALSSRARPG